MTMNDLSKKYSPGTRVIHWLTATLVLILFPLGKYMEDLLPADKMNFVLVHISLGILMFLATLLRSYFFFKHERPAKLLTGSRITDNLAVWIHDAFYYLLIGLALSGIAVVIVGGYGQALLNGTPEVIKSHGNIPPLALHGLLAGITMILILLHVLGYLIHLIQKKENTIKRIF
jgi:cytochrome b561